MKFDMELCFLFKMLFEPSFAYSQIKTWPLVGVTYKTGLDWMFAFIGTLYIQNSGLQLIEFCHRCMNITVHRYTRIKIPSLH
jgi:hypothetical protein